MKKTVNVAIMGIGTVGGGTYEILTVTTIFFCARRAWITRLPKCSIRIPTGSKHSEYPNPARQKAWTKSPKTRA